MFENLKKSLDKGIDYAFMTTEKLTQAAKDLAKENNLTKEEAKKLLDQLLKKSEEARETVEVKMQEVIQASLKKMNIPTKDELKKLETRIRQLEAKVNKPVASKSKKVTPGKPKTSPKK